MLPEKLLFGKMFGHLWSHENNTANSFSSFVLSGSETTEGQTEAISEKGKQNRKVKSRNELCYIQIQNYSIDL